MTFTTPCFVRVENVEERLALIHWGHDLGYGMILVDGFPHAYWVSAHEGVMSNGERHWPGIDCGTNVEMFKALAAKNNENDREQWFVEEGRMFKCMEEKLKNYSCHSIYTRKATAEEIIEHYKA